MAPTAPFLVDLYKQFPFAEGSIMYLTANASSLEAIPDAHWPRSFRVHLACMVSLIINAMLPKGCNRLGYAYNANAQRSGKSLLAQSAICPVHGWTAGRSWPVGGDKKSATDENELRKVLDTISIEGASYAFFDNVRAQVESPAMEAFMTLPVWNGRLLGGNRSFTAPTNCTIIVTANNLKLSVDMVERFLQCDLFVEEVEAQTRVVTNSIEQNWIMQHRDEIFAAAYGLVEHWDSLGRPPAPGRVRRGFETYSHMVGGIIAAAGFGDLFEPRLADSNSGNTVDTDMRKLVALMVDRLQPHMLTQEIPTHGFTFDDLAQLAFQNSLFTYYLEGREEVSAATGVTRIHLTQSANARFGNCLKNYAPERRGRTWSMPHGATFRFRCEGEGRARKYLAAIHLTPRARLHYLMLSEGIGLASLSQVLESQGFPSFDACTHEDHLQIISVWPSLVPHLRSLN
jgi:hypothetical protein